MCSSSGSKLEDISGTGAGPVCWSKLYHQQGTRGAAPTGLMFGLQDAAAAAAGLHHHHIHHHHQPRGPSMSTGLKEEPLTSAGQLAAARWMAPPVVDQTK